MKTIIDQNVINELATQGKGAATVANLRGNLAQAKITEVLQDNGGNFVFVQENGESFPVHAGTIVAKWASLPTSGLDGGFAINAPKGFIFRSLLGLPAWNLRGEVTTTVTTVKTAAQQLLADIRTAFVSEIAEINGFLQSIVKDESLQTDYLKRVEETKELKIFNITVDASNTIMLLQREKMAEKLEQLESVFEGTKTEVEITLSDDCTTAEVQLNGWDKNNSKIVLERLAAFKMAGKFADDKNGILAKLNCQLLTVTF